MTSEINKSLHTFNNLRLSRQVKRSPTDKPKTLVALPDDIPETTWVEILNTEETELMILSIREDIIVQAMDVCYERYMEKQKFAFTAHCAAEACLQIIDWHYFRHDPGEESSAYPPADIPNRELSWIPDEIPEPSPKDTWCRHDLEVGEAQEEACSCSCSSLDMVEARIDGEDRIGEAKEDEESCACDSNMAESSPCECSEKSKAGGAAASSSTNSNYPSAGVRKMDSLPHGPVSSECGSGDSTSGAKPTRTKNIFSQRYELWKERLQEPQVRVNLVPAIGPVLKQWLTRKTGALSFRLTQMLTGHGCYGRYMCEIVSREETTRCHHCDCDRDTAEHTITACPSSIVQRAALSAAIGPDLSLPALFRAMLSGEQEWKAVEDFAHDVISAKEEAERIKLHLD